MYCNVWFVSLFILLIVDAQRESVKICDVALLAPRKGGGWRALHMITILSLTFILLAVRAFAKLHNDTFIIEIDQRNQMIDIIHTAGNSH